MSAAGFAFDEFEEYAVCEPDEIVVCWEVVVRMGRPPQQFGQDLVSLGWWQRLNALDRAFGCVRHE